MALADRTDAIDDLEDTLAEFEQELKDFSDLWDGIEPLEKRASERPLQDLLDQLTAFDLVVGVGTHTMKLEAPAGEPKGFRMTFMLVKVVLKGLPKPAFQWEHKGRIEFK